MKMLKYFAVFIAYFGSVHVRAAETYEYYNGIRGLGMGGADIAVVNDETALLINPAGLGKLRDKYGTLIDPEWAWNENFSSIYNSKPVTSPTDIEKIQPVLDLSRNKQYHFHWQAFPSYVVKNFGIGVFTKSSLDAKTSADGTLMTTKYFYDTALVLGYNFRFLDGRIKLGFNVKAMNRATVDGDLTTSGSMKLKDNALEGSGLGNDVGLMLTAPWATLPTLSVVVRDVSNTKFTNAGYLVKPISTTRPAEIKQDADVAIAFFPISGNRTRSTITLQANNMLTASTEENKTKLYHFGYELNMSDLFFFRLGANGKYWTTGVELASERTQFQMAYYGEEIGTLAAPEEERRFAFKWSFRF